MEEKNGRKKTGEKKSGKINPEKIPGNFLLENLPVNLFGNFTPENKAQENETNKKAGISAAEYMGIFQIAHRLAGGKGVALHWRYMGQFLEARLEASKADHQEQGQAWRPGTSHTHTTGHQEQGSQGTGQTRWRRARQTTAATHHSSPACSRARSTGQGQAQPGRDPGAGQQGRP